MNTHPDGGISARPGSASVVRRPAEVEVHEVDKGEPHASCGGNADAAVGAVLDPHSCQGIGNKCQQSCMQAVRDLACDAQAGSGILLCPQCDSFDCVILPAMEDWC